MRRLALLGTLLALVASLIFVGAAAADPSVTDQKVDAPDKLTVGDHFRYVAKLTADNGTTVTLAPGGLPPAFALTRAPTVSSSSSGGHTTVTVTLDLTAFATGDLDLAPKFSFKGPGSAAGDVIAPPVKVTVASVLPADASSALSPKDLKPQAEIGEAPPASLWPVAVVVVLVLVLGSVLFVFGRRAIRRRRRLAAANALEAQAEDEAPLTAEDRARRILDKAGADFALDGDYVTYYMSIAGTLREYLTERFGFPAFAMTTTELQDQMVRRGMDRWQARIAAGLLSQCDAVVYASYRPATERADHDLTAAYEIIEMSRPGAEPEPEPEHVDFRPPSKREPYPDPTEIEL